MSVQTRSEDVNVSKDNCTYLLVQKQYNINPAPFSPVHTQTVWFQLCPATERHISSGVQKVCAVWHLVCLLDVL